MSFTCRFFSSLGDDSHWSQYWENRVFDQELSSTHGQLYGFLSLNTPNASNEGRNLIDKFNQQYLASITSIPTNLKQLGQLFLENNFTSSTLILIVIHHQDIYILHVGDGQSYLFRQGQYSHLLSTLNNDQRLISGKIIPDDIFLFATSNFISNFSLNRLYPQLSTGNLQSFEESIIADVASLSPTSQSSSLLIKIIANDSIDKPSTPLPAPPIDSTPAPTPVINPVQNSPPINPPRPQISVRPLTSFMVAKRKRIGLILTLIILILIVISSVYSYRRNQSIANENQYQTNLQAIIQRLDQASKIRSLSLPDSQKQLSEAKDLITQTRQLNIHLDELDRLDSQIKEQLSTSGSSIDFQPTKFYDTTNISSDSDYRQILFFNQKLFLVDPSKRIDSLAVSTKSYSTVLDNISSSIIDVASDNGNIYYLTSTNLYQIKNQSSVSQLTHDSNFSHINFWNGNLYLLSSNTLSRATPSGTSFSTPKPWLNDQVSLDPSTTSFAINGSIWTITKNGTISSFTRGAKDNFVSKAKLQVTSASQLHTAPDFDYLVFVDQSSVVNVLSKTSDSVSQYNFGSLTIYDIALDSANRTVYVLCSDKNIYQITF